MHNPAVAGRSSVSSCPMQQFHVFFVLGCLLLLGSCTPAPLKEVRTSALPCVRRQPVYLYVTNWSRRTSSDSQATLIIDDSVYFDQKVKQSTSSEEKFQRIIALCEGPHRITGRFGRIQRDTMLSVTAKSSLLMAMVYNPKWVVADVAKNSIEFALLKRMD